MSTLVDVIRAHIPLDRYDEEGEPVSTYCECGGWEGDWFGDGEAGPFDVHLAAMVGEWLASACRAWAVGRFDEHGPLDQRGAALWDVAAWASEGAEAVRNGPRSDDEATRDGLRVATTIGARVEDMRHRALPGGYCTCGGRHDQSRVTDSGEAARGDE